MTITKSLILSALTLLLSACSDGKSKQIDQPMILDPSIQVIGGHHLPPEPDPVLNNATVLGIDSNNNGVRDDVERWIYAKYGRMHPINAAIGMEAARVYQKILAHPERAQELRIESYAMIACETYLQYYAKMITKEVNSRYFRNQIIFNTSDREIAYDKYNDLLSGGSYRIERDPLKKRAKCPESIKEMLP